MSYRSMWALAWASRLFPGLAVLGSDGVSIEVDVANSYSLNIVRDEPALVKRRLAYVHGVVPEATMGAKWLRTVTVPIVPASML